MGHKISYAKDLSPWHFFCPDLAGACGGMLYFGIFPVSLGGDLDLLTLF
jgi:hypothetical protein